MDKRPILKFLFFFSVFGLLFGLSACVISELTEIDLKCGQEEIASGSVVSFGTLSVIDTAMMFYRIENNGVEDLKIYSIFIAGKNRDEFFLDTYDMNMTILPGESESFVVGFQPMDPPGKKSAVLIIANNDADETIYKVFLTGTVSEPEPDISISKGITYIPPENAVVDFGQTTAGTQGETAEFSIKNYGDADLSIYDITLSDATDFILNTDNIPPSLGPWESAIFTVTFYPMSTGDKSDVLTIESNDTEYGTINIALTGAATSEPMPEINIGRYGTIENGGSYDFGDIPPGEQNELEFTIDNLGDAELNITDVTLSGDPEFTITQEPDTNIEPGNSTTFRVVFSPVDLGERSAVITIWNNDQDEGEYIINFQGTGFIRG